MKRVSRLLVFTMILALPAIAAASVGKGTGSLGPVTGSATIVSVGGGLGGSSLSQLAQDGEVPDLIQNLAQIAGKISTGDPGQTNNIGVATLGGRQQGVGLPDGKLTGALRLPQLRNGGSQLVVGGGVQNPGIPNTTFGVTDIKRGIGDGRSGNASGGVLNGQSGQGGLVPTIELLLTHRGPTGATGSNGYRGGPGSTGGQI